LGFGPDVFADALVPRRRVAARRVPKNLETPVPATAWLHAGIRCADGYRFAKRQGKPNSANLAVAQQNNRFCDFATGGAPNPFRFDSSQSLNCSSNLIGHDHPNKPANGGGE
jgi:hypothetical protein